MLVWNKIFVINSFIICEVYDYFDDKTTFYKKRVSLLIVSLQNRRVIFNSILNKTFDNLIHNKKIPINFVEFIIANEFYLLYNIQEV